MVDAKVPLHYRDTCAGLLIPLNECRRETLFMPWKCQDLRHAYEKCQYMECVPNKLHCCRREWVVWEGVLTISLAAALAVYCICRWKKRVDILKNGE
ncbi:hypothetical protein PINS_up020070 [Pythium insidiosum]|nr:hypothetical protein PINS_up020070 [Pythium insidiosum]